jgi:hypothetical protein
MIWPMLLLGHILRRRRGSRRTRRRTRRWTRRWTRKEEEEELIFGWAKVLLSFKQVLYAALDAHLGFEIARSYWKLQGYNSHVDRLNI